MTDWVKKQRRKEEVRERAAHENSMYGYCRVIGCGKPARAGSPDGLDMKFCRSHADHHQRHGSAYKGSYPAHVLNPYRRAALDWLLANQDNPWVSGAVLRVQGVYRQAGPHIEAFRLRGKSPRERAWAAWARLRKNDVNPLLPVAAWLAVEMVIRDDQQPVNTLEYKRVQAAKVVHRMASGSHKRWEMELSDSARSDLGKPVLTKELHVYPKSRGLVLRYIGADLEEAVELLVDHHLEDVRLFMQGRKAVPSNNARKPHPRRLGVKRKG